MTLFADASALVSIVAREHDWQFLADRVERYETRLCSALGAWETVTALCRNFALTDSQARARLKSVLNTSGFLFVDIGEREYELAATAYATYGKGRHPAGLNMGDCFTYACTKAHDARLLFKGNDFTQTDLVPA